MTVKSFTDRGERYPQPIGNFAAWFNARCHEAATASRWAEIEAAVGAVRAYVDAEWCLPSRLGEIMAIASKRSKELDRKSASETASRMTGDA